MEDAGVARFSAFVASARIVCQIVDAGSRTLTVSQAAAALDVDEPQVIKTLLFHDGAAGHVIAISNGTARVDAELLAAHAGTGTLKLAKPQVVQDMLGYPAGGVPPLGLPPDIPVVVDTAASRLETCVAGAGSITHLARLSMADILRLNTASIATIVTG